MDRTAWIIIIVILAILVGRSVNRSKQRQGIEHSRQNRQVRSDAFDSDPVINSHRIRCPDCGGRATLLVNQRGLQRRICDQCGTEDL